MKNFENDFYSKIEASKRKRKSVATNNKKPFISRTWNKI